MAEALWTKKKPPPEYVILQLCRDVYHCRPSELLEEDAARVYVHLVMMGIEAKVNNA